MRRICNVLAVTLLCAAVFTAIIDILARLVLRQASTNFHSNGRMHEQHRPATHP